jgi:hypothetical protein
MAYTEGWQLKVNGFVEWKLATYQQDSNKLDNELDLPFWG